MEETYTISGEVDYSSQQKKIGGEYELIGEVLREVAVSNPYDAGAERIHLYPLFTEDASCLIVVDDGVGMDTARCSKDALRGCNGHAMSSLASYFHIGHSTKPRGKEIGQFCMGSNLALAQADALFALVTRTRDTPQGSYWVVIQERMHMAFSDPSKRIQSKIMTAADARRTVLDLLQDQSECYVTAWAAWIDHAFGALCTEHGTLQLFVSKGTDLHQKRLLDVERRSVPDHKKTKRQKVAERSIVQFTALYTYLRVHTRHGSFLNFPTRRCEMRQRDAFRDVYDRDMRQATLTIFCNACVEGEVVPYGFPYIQYAKDTPDRHAERLTPGREIKSKTGYWARLGPAEFTRNTSIGKTPVTVFVAIDSYNIKMEKYEGLDRRGCASRSGIPMYKTNGIVLTVHGVYVTTLRGDAFEKLISALPTIEDDSGLGSIMHKDTLESLLAWNDKQKLHNITIVVDSVFEIKTDRNNITPAEMQRLVEDRSNFLVGFANALQDFRDGTSAHSKIFDDMLEYMLSSKKREDESNVTENAQQRAQDSLECGSICVKPRPDMHTTFAAILDVVQETYALPGKGHENSLVHLFGLYGAAARSLSRAVRRWPDLCPRNTRFRGVAHLWERFGLLFNGAGVDAQIFAWDVSNDATHFGERVKCAVQHMRQCEFKIELEEKFNHPFLSCDLIVVASVDSSLVKVVDSMNNVAEVIQPPLDDPLHGIGFYLENIQNGHRTIKSRVDRSENLRVPVIEFQKLVHETFAPFATVVIVPPRRIFDDAPKSARKAKSK